jgi:hypothetical protein
MGKNRLARIMIALSLAAVPAEARQWSPAPQAAAADYTQIVHVKPNGQLVFVWWVVPEIFAPMPNTQALLNVLSRYTVIGVAQGRPAANGALAMDPVQPVQITDQSGRSYSPLAENSLPADVTQAIATLQAIARQNPPLAPIAQGIRWFVFQADTIHSCAPGKVSVPFGGETYIYDTPVPGCVK